MPSHCILQGVLDTLTQTKQPSETEEEQSTLLCDHCDEQEKATHYCEHCQENMCKLHTKAHKKGKKTKMHHMTPLTQYEPIMSDAVVVRECPTHKGEKLSIVCSTCDDLLICKECAIVLPQKTHDYELVRDVIDERRQNLKVIVDKTASFTTKLTQDVSIIANLLSSSRNRNFKLPRIL